MPSPFPGMNPFLEKAHRWQDFHQTFLVHLRGALNAQLGPGYYASIEEFLYIHELPEDLFKPLGRADLNISRSEPASPPRPREGTTISTPTQVVVDPTIDVERQISVEIRDREFDQVITVIELLSPANKTPGSDREQYLAKRRKLLRSKANLVEIDLLRGGERLPIRDLPACSYYVLVSRPDNRPRATLWAIQLRERLPVIPIPLRQGEPDLPLDLQECLQSAFDDGRYDKTIYRTNPEPPLSPEDDAWARGLIPSTP